LPSGYRLSRGSVDADVGRVWQELLAQRPLHAYQKLVLGAVGVLAARLLAGDLENVIFARLPNAAAAWPPVSLYPFCWMKPVAYVAALLLGVSAAPAQTSEAIARYLAMLERPEREAFQKPAQVMAALALRRGERVADIGAGSGYFTIPVAKAVGPRGTVWALDIRQPMLDFIAARLEKERLTNVKLKRVLPDDPQLPPESVDTILMVDVYHYIHFEKRGAEYAVKLRPGLAKGGRVIVIDYTPRPFDERPWGPPPEQQMSRETLDGYMAAGGLKPARQHTFLPEQYFVEYRLR
jgi:SAM-dependent methyltransferase